MNQQDPLLGASCAHAERGENCRRTDCFSCGREAFAQLRAEALLDNAGLIAFAREVVRVQGSRGDDAATVADLAWLRGWHQMPMGAPREQAHREAIAWAEGVTEELRGVAFLAPGDYHNNDGERAAYLQGVAFARLHGGSNG